MPVLTATLRPGGSGLSALAPWRHPDVATLFVVIAAIGFGTVPIFAKGLSDAGMPPQMIAISRYALTSVVLLPFLRLRNGLWRITLYGMAGGAGLGLGWTGYVNALDHAPVSTVGVLYMTYPIFTLAIAWAFFGERPGRRSGIAAAMILAAAVLAMSPGAVSVAQLPALGLSLAAPLAFGISINLLTQKLVLLKPLSRMASISLGSVLGLLPIVLSSEVVAVLPDTPDEWTMVAGLALATALVPQLVYTVCAPVIGSARTAMAGSVELPTMFAIGFLVFSEPLGPAQIAAGAIVVAAIALTPSKPSANARYVQALVRVEESDAPKERSSQ